MNAMRDCYLRSRSRSTGLRLIPSEVFSRIRRKQQPKLQQLYKILVATVAAKGETRVTR